MRWDTLLSVYSVRLWSTLSWICVRATTMTYEFYADEFADALLMPEAEILRRQQEHWTVPRMAAHFNVTVGVVAKRLERLEKNLLDLQDQTHI